MRVVRLFLWKPETLTCIFPNTYFVGIEIINQTAVFPYFVGDTYRSKLLDQNINQDFDFNNSDLLRNTLQYAVADVGSDNDFINEPNENNHLGVTDFQRFGGCLFRGSVVLTLEQS